VESEATPTALTATADAVAQARLEHEIKRNLVSPTPLELQAQVVFPDKTPEERERQVKLVAAQLGCPDLVDGTAEGTLHATQNETTAVWFSESSPFPDPTDEQVTALNSAKSVEEISEGPVATHPAFLRATLVVKAKDAQVFDVVLAAVAAAPKLTAMKNDLLRLRATNSGLIAQRVIKIVGAGVDTLTKADGKQAWEELATCWSDWGAPNATAFSIVAGAERVVARTFDICEVSGFVTNSTMYQEMVRMLFKAPFGQQSELYCDQGVKLYTLAQTTEALDLPEHERKKKLYERAAALPKKKAADLTSDTAGVKSVRGAGASAAEVAAMKARIKSLEAQALAQTTQSKSGGGGGGKAPTRVAAAAAVSAPSPNHEFCRFCKVAGHSVSDCTVVEFVAGAGGAEVQRWAQCWRCSSFGHVKKDCPTPASASSSSPRLNGPALPSAGGGLAR
jgi:hypothetical protein